MTSSRCLTGTDRVAECAEKLDSDIFINVQGDEPLFNPEDIKKLLNESKKYPKDVINGYCEILDERDFRNPSIPKVIIRPDGRLLYMSRANIPSTKKLNFVKAWRQVCAYVFPRKSLMEFKSLKKKTPLEDIEDIEILRFLELGMEVRMIKLSDNSIAIDRPEDVRKVELAIKKKRNHIN